MKTTKFVLFAAAVFFFFSIATGALAVSEETKQVIDEALYIKFLGVAPLGAVMVGTIFIIFIFCAILFISCGVGITFGCSDIFEYECFIGRIFKKVNIVADKCTMVSGFFACFFGTIFFIELIILFFAIIILAYSK
jgi:hypothetical protein